MAVTLPALAVAHQSLMLFFSLGPNVGARTVLLLRLFLAKQVPVAIGIWSKIQHVNATPNFRTVRIELSNHTSQSSTFGLVLSSMNRSDMHTYLPCVVTFLLEL